MTARIVVDAFDEYDGALKLSLSERDAAIERHHEIRDWLEDAGISVAAILQGSFRRKTMLTPLRDIDMVVFLASDRRDLMDRASGSDEAMSTIEASLCELYPNALFSRSRHALKIDFGDGEFSFDVVPAFDRDGSDLVDIANREDGTWDESDTRLIIAAVQERNKVCHGGFVRQVRMIKAWGRTATPDTPGFVLECIAYAAITQSEDHAQALAVAFAEGHRLADSGEVVVPGGDENVLARLLMNQRAQLQAALREASERASEAIVLDEAGDTEAAIDVWNELLGEPFPEAETQGVAEAFAAMAGGGVTSSGRATHTPKAHSPAPATRSWRSA